MKILIKIRNIGALFTFNNQSCWIEIVYNSDSGPIKNNLFHRLSLIFLQQNHFSIAKLYCANLALVVTIGFAYFKQAR